MRRRIMSKAPAFLVFLITGWIGALVGAQTGIPAPGAPVSFAKDVQPVLETNCLTCHGESMRMGRFDLRTRESALAGGTRGSDIIPGDADGSRLYRRVAGLEQPSMPAQGAPLTALEIAAIKQWIDAGAKW